AAEGLTLCCSDAAGAGADISVLVRPERIDVEPLGSTKGDPRRNRFEARIAEVTYLGEDLHLSLELASGQLFRAAMKNGPTARVFARSQQVEFAVAPDDIRLLRR